MFSLKKLTIQLHIVSHFRGVFRIQSNIYDEASLREKLTAKSFIVDVGLGS